jgi:glutamate dehydrogenase
VNDVVNAALESLGMQGDDSQRVLVSRALKHLNWDDLSGFTPHTLVQHLEHLRAVGETRLENRTNVDVRDLGDAEFTVSTIVSDDLTYLVESIVGGLRKEEKSPLLILHPQLWVRRDSIGRLIEILNIDVDEPAPNDARKESWVLVELERDFVNEDNTRTAHHLRQIAHDVRCAHDDELLMQDKARELARVMTNTSSSIWNPDDAKESAAFMRWLIDGHFLFLGYQEYTLSEAAKEVTLTPVESSGLGILRDDRDGSGNLPVVLSNLAAQRARDGFPLVITKANSRSTVHRTSYLDYVSVRVTSDTGAVIGEYRFLGLYIGSAFSESVTAIPVLRVRYARMLQAMDVIAGSHSARDLSQFMESIPRDEFFSMQTDQLIDLGLSVVNLSEQQKVKSFFRLDEFGRYVSAYIFVPRENYTTNIRLSIQELIREFFGAISVDFSVFVGEGSHAHLHFIAHLRSGYRETLPDTTELVDSIEIVTRTWKGEFTQIALNQVGRVEVATFLHQFIEAFPESYQAMVTPDIGVADALCIMALEPADIAIEVKRFPGSNLAEIRLIRSGDPISLSQVLPLLQNFGVRVLNEYPFEIHRKGFGSAWVLQFGIELPDGELPDLESLNERLANGLRQAWFGQVESDFFNGLVVTAGLLAYQVAVVRAYARYMRQIGSAFGQDYIQQVALSYPQVIALLVELFASQFDPAAEIDREVARSVKIQVIEEALDAVPVLDHDRILRTFYSLILATLRTSVYLPAGEAIPRAFAFKLDSRAIPEMPLPKPLVEIWVSSPRVEGVHLRFGQVARGGLRWSDRREDFRTEILGLVKAQEVKNAVIVPVGAKGGFVPVSLPDPKVDRDGWLAAGKAAYQEFVSALLDLTDNLRDGQVLAPQNILRRDGDDPYLVVAADKGTASFSDIANAIAVSRGFWLGDAFASGGSLGYDHKAMGITARGAWISVERHFRELGIDTHRDLFTVVGVGDMSGDVFGNGMLLSDQIKLVAAFDHRDIFIDPDPNPATSLLERRRIFELERSSWADFDLSLISTGGGVFSRSAKSILLSEQACLALGIDSGSRTLAPNEVIRAILRAPVDLLWNAGIGTYVKATSESNLDVGDKACDATRIDGGELRCKVVGEGGNLGLTQLGRIEAALAGVLLNTDAIDNSAGVDTSDHEVNLKILLDGFVRGGQLSGHERNEVLSRITGEVAVAVLADNYGQNVVLANAKANAVTLLPVHQRMIRDLEHQGALDRSIEFLPTDEELDLRRQEGRGLTSPELAVLLAYVKIVLAADLNKSNIGKDSWYQSALFAYFPSEIVHQFREGVLSHQLRDQIISTVVCNEVVNAGGISFVYRAVEETSANTVEVVNAAVAVLEIFDLPRLMHQINDLDGQVPATAQHALHLQLRRILDRATRWILTSRTGHLVPQVLVDTYRPIIGQYASQLRTHLPEGLRDDVLIRSTELIEVGAPIELAREVSSLLEVFSLLDIADLAKRTGVSPDRIIPLYLAVTEAYGIDPLLTAISNLPRTDRWSVLARQALRADLYSVTAALTQSVLSMDQGSAALTMASWEGHYATSTSRARSTLMEIVAVEHPDIATISVALRVLRTLIAQTSTS